MINLKVVKIISAVINSNNDFLKIIQINHFVLKTKNYKPTIPFINKANIHKKIIIKAKANFKDKKLFKTKSLN